MDGVSLYRQEYAGHKAGPIQLMKRKEGRTIPSAKFEANPTYACKLPAARLIESCDAKILIAQLLGMCNNLNI